MLNVICFNWHAYSKPGVFLASAGKMLSVREEFSKKWLKDGAELPVQLQGSVWLGSKVGERISLTKGKRLN